jgi:hypothetical protein
MKTLSTNPSDKDTHAVVCEEEETESQSFDF